MLATSSVWQKAASDSLFDWMDQSRLEPVVVAAGLIVRRLFILYTFVDRDKPGTLEA